MHKLSTSNTSIVPLKSMALVTNDTKESFQITCLFSIVFPQQ